MDPLSAQLTTPLSELPLVYSEMAPQVLRQAIPSETFASCAKCPMACSQHSASQRRFSPRTKCCTYFPSLPNYLVGAILADATNPDGGDRLRQKISKRVGVTPAGVYPPRTFHVLYNSSREAFGQSESLVCPYFRQEDGACAVWRHRESICSTYFCKHVAGKDGKRFWDALNQYLKLIQRAIAIHAMLRLNVVNSADIVDTVMSRDYAHGQLKSQDLASEVSEELYCSVWGSMVGAEEAYFINCYEIASQLTENSLSALVGVEYDHHISRLVSAFHAAYDIPKGLKLSRVPLQKTPDGVDYIVPISHARTSLTVPTAVIDAFSVVKDKESAKAGIQKATGRNIGDDLLIKLVKAGILESSEES